MSRLIRMDPTGHTTLAEWSTDDPAAVESAAAAFREQLERGYLRRGLARRGQAEQVRELPARRAGGDPAPPDRRRLVRSSPRSPLAALPEPSGAQTSAALPELAAVPWRPRVSDRLLTRRGRLWTLSTLAHRCRSSPPRWRLAIAQADHRSPSALILLAHAWIIPELYAARGANVVRPVLAPSGSGPDPAQERSVLLLGDLVGHAARRLHAETGFVAERGRARGMGARRRGGAAGPARCAAEFSATASG